MPDITMASQVMTMDSNNNSADNVASKLAEITITSPDSNNNKGESGDAGTSPTKVSLVTDLETVPESEAVNTHDESHDKVSESGKENVEISENSLGNLVTPTEDAAANDATAEIDGLAVDEINDQAEINYEDTHPLERPWTMWFMNGDTKNKNKAMLDNGSEWNQGLIELYTFDTVEDFWAVYNHIQLPAKLRLKNDYMVFRSGVRPEWEDSGNRGGGMWKLILPSKMRSTDLDRMWLETLLSMIGESYGSLGDLICGAYLQRRQKEDRIQLWTTKGTEEEVKEIGAILKEKLNLSKDSHIHYLKHDDQTQGQNTGKNMSWSRKHKSDSLYHI